MFGIHDFPLFLAAALAVILTPGADTALVVASSLRFGVRGGVMAALGVGGGCFVHIGAATVGLSALLMASATAFAALKWAGVAYLGYLGMRMLTARPAPAQALDAQVAAARSHSLVAQGFLCNVLNPKVALFFLAFLPQFVTAGAAHSAIGFFALGALFAVAGVAWLSLLAALIGRSAACRPWRRTRLWFERAVGAALIALAARLALASRS